MNTYNVDDAFGNSARVIAASATRAHDAAVSAWASLGVDYGEGQDVHVARARSAERGSDDATS